MLASLLSGHPRHHSLSITFYSMVKASFMVTFLNRVFSIIHCCKNSNKNEKEFELTCGFDFTTVIDH